MNSESLSEAHKAVLKLSKDHWLYKDAFLIMAPKWIHKEYGHQYIPYQAFEYTKDRNEEGKYEVIPREDFPENLNH